MIQKIKNKLSNLNSDTVGRFLTWLGVILTFLSISVGVFYNLDPLTGCIFFSVTLTLLGVLVTALS